MTGTDERKYHDMGLRRKKSLIDQAADYVDAMKPQIESAVTTAKDKALPLIADAREKATPVVVTGAAIAADRASQAASVAAEKAAIGREIAAQKAAVGRELAAAKVAQLKGEPEPKAKGGKLKKALLLGGLMAVVGVIVQKLRGSSDSDNWQSSYKPTPPPTATSTPTPVADSADDGAGSSPDEALADATEEPHPVTTPDEPADVITIDEDAARNN